MGKTREIWVDNVKVFACILVVLGHFFQSMTKSEILSESDFLLCFDQMIYYFHVPLFFICSGYLYQKYSHINTVNLWRRNILKKAVVLGVPYFAFSTMTWVIKMLFSGSVNDQPQSLLSTLFFQPSAPYWYLYALFFLFLIIPTFSDKKLAVVGFAVALLMKIVSGYVDELDIFALSTVFENTIWFMSGICLCRFDFVSVIKKKSGIVAGVIIAVIFVVASIVVYICNVEYKMLDFLLGFAACVATISIMCWLYKDNIAGKFTSFLARFTMPIYLMHTIFAATFRSVLLKVGVEVPAVHIVIGLMISFIGPILAAVIMEKIKFLDFLLYPDKYIKFDKLSKGDLKCHKN